MGASEIKMQTLTKICFEGDREGFQKEYCLNTLTIVK